MFDTRESPPVYIADEGEDPMKDPFDDDDVMPEVAAWTMALPIALADEAEGGD